MPKSVDIVSLILIVTGGIMVYGARGIMILLKIKDNDKAFIIVKVIGLILAVAGCFRVLKFI